MNPIPLSPNFARILLLSTALIVSISTAIAGGRSGERNLMDDYLQSKTSVNSSASSAAMAVLIETIRAVLNSRMRAKFGLRDIGFMILNPER
jgi:hypothetical protein